MPDWVQYVRRNLGLSGIKPEYEVEIVEDLARQLDDAYREARSRGLSEAEATACAREHIPDWAQLARELGQAERRHAQSRTDIWFDRAEQAAHQRKGGIWTVFADLKRDLLYGLRMLRKNPGFTAVAVLTLALGIGANTAIFTWINGSLLNPLPGVKDSSELVEVTITTREGRNVSFSYPNYEDYRDRNTVLSGLAVHSSRPMSLVQEDKAERLWGSVVSANFFDVLEVRPIVGRGFLPEEGEAPGRDAVMIISYGLWQRSFGGNPEIVGKQVTLNSHPFTIVGVAPKEFQGALVGLALDAWVPMMMANQIVPGGDRLRDRGHGWMQAKARLKPGITLEQAQAEMSTLAGQLGHEYPDTNEGRGVALYPIWRSPNGAQSVLGPVLFVLMGMVGLVLLIACANVANLLLARANARRKEIAIRLSLGAHRVRLVRQLLTESVLLSLLGGAGGLLMAYWGSGLLGSLVPPTQYPIRLHVSVDGRVLLFTLAVATLTGLIFGLVPALQSSRGDMVTALKDESGRSTGGRHKGMLRNTLVVAQISLSLVLLISAGLFVRSLQRAQTFDPGFRTHNILLAGIDLLPNGYSREESHVFFQQLLSKLKALPGVEAAALGRYVPLDVGGESDSSFRVEGYQPAPDEVVWAYHTDVTPDYFRTMEIPLVRGRDFTLRDNVDSAPVAIINETIAQRYWKDRDPLGQQFTMGSTAYTTVGIAQDIKYRTLNEDPAALIFFPVYQRTRMGMTIHLRTTGDAAALTPAVRSAVQLLDPKLPIFAVRTMETHMVVTTLQQTIASSLLGAFGLLALTLTSVGIYGILAYSVGQRTHEIGVRMALGASHGAVLRAVLRQGLVLILMGVALGLVSALGLTRFLQSLLFGVTPTDPLALVAAVLLLGVVAFLACYIPARRAAKVDPMVALRYE